MGHDLFQSVFGGSSSESQSQSTSHSGNYAYPYIQSTFAPVAGQGGASTGQLAGMLGLGGGDPQAFQKYLNSTGYNFMLDSGSKAITNNAAARGLLNSGSTLKALNTFGTNLASQYTGNYLGQLSDLAKLAIGGGSLIANAGQYSDSNSAASSDESKETGAFGKFLGSILASDIRLKENIEKIGLLPDGLGIYEFDYRRDIDPELPEGRQVGVMAHEVAQLQPWALGPRRPDGYSTVDYLKIRTTPDPATVARFI